MTAESLTGLGLTGCWRSFLPKALLHNVSPRLTVVNGPAEKHVLVEEV